MKGIVITIALSLLLKAGMAQTIPAFSRLFFDTVALRGGGINITSIKDSIYFSLFDQNSSDAYQVLDFIQTDEGGNELKRYSLYKQRYYYASNFQHNLKATSDGHLICGCEEADSTLLWTSFLYKFNTALDSLYKHPYYNVTRPIEFFSTAELSDGNYVLAGNLWDTANYYNNQALIMKTDTSGNMLWQKAMSSDVLNYACFTSPFPGGFYQCWHTFHNNTINNGVDSAIFVDRYDNDGNLKWRDTFGIVGNENVPGPLTATQDGGGVVVVNALDTSNPHIGLIGIPQVVYRFDSNGTIVWVHYFPDSPEYKIFNSMVETHSGNMVLCGAGMGGFTVSNPGGYGGGALLKMDKNGNTIFYQVYRYDTLVFWDALNDITETGDGGYAAIGNAYHSIGVDNYEGAWLLKVDSNGCLNGDCPTLTSVQDITDEQGRFIVFPVPASGAFTVAVTETDQFRSYRDLHFTMYDLTGRMVYEQPLTQQATVIQRGDLATGIYLYHISDAGRAVSNGKVVFK